MKELSIEEKARRYESALERCRRLYNEAKANEYTSDIEDYEYIFPELAESEDEKTRKDILTFVKREGQHIDKYKWHKWIAWLEKHKPVEHLELKAGHWYICHRAYCCRADDLTIKEGERFMCEKDGVVKGFMIKDPEKYFIEVHAPAPMEDDQNNEVRRRSTIQVLEYARSLDAYNQYGKADIDKNIAWLEKQGEQKYIDDLTKQEAMDIAVAKCFEQGKQKPAWTESDDEEFEIAINALKDAGQYDSAAWILTIKQRIGG